MQLHGIAVITPLKETVQRYGAGANPASGTRRAKSGKLNRQVALTGPSFIHSRR